MHDVFEGAQYGTEDIEAALSAAEASLRLPLGGESVAAAAAWPECPQQSNASGLESWQGQADRLGNSSHEPQRPPSALTLGETALALRLTLHDKEMELLQLRQEYMQLVKHGERVQQSLEEGLRERDGRIVRLEAALGRREAALEQLSVQLQAFQGLTPEAAAALRAENVALAAAKRAAEAAAGEAAQRADDAGRRVLESVATWERLQAELQGENGRLAATLQRQHSELAGLFQEKEVLRAKAAMLEARAAAAPALLPTAASPRQSQAPEAVELRRSLAEALQRVDERESTARKYREAVRTLKRRLSELEGKQADKATAEAARDAEAAEAAAALTQCKQQLAEARQQHQQFHGRLAQMEAQLQKADYERAQWEWRAKDAEQRAQAAGESAESSSAAAACLAERSRAQAEAQAKAAALKALQLEKRLAQVQQQLHVQRQQDQSRDKEQLLATHTKDVWAQLAAAQQQHAIAEQALQRQLQAKAAALAASEKKLRHLGAVLRRVADKPGSSWLTGAA